MSRRTRKFPVAIRSISGDAGSPFLYQTKDSISPDGYLTSKETKMEATYQMVDKNPDEHWYDVEGHQLHEERMREGFELFGKYYKNLWD